MLYAAGNQLSARPVQPTRPGWRFWLWWMLATLVGAAAGMFLSFPLQVMLETLIGTEITTPWTTAQTALIVLFKGAEGGVMGLGMGLGQGWVFRKHLAQTGGWVLATGLALFLQGAFRWSLPYETPPWQVGVITAFSFGVFLGACQWCVLRGRVPNAGWWIAISMAGWVAALAVEAISEYAQFSIESPSGMALFAVSLLVPFAGAGAGMVWLLRQAPLTRAPVAA
jgi:hypothetical protein